MKKILILILIEIIIIIYFSFKIYNKGSVLGSFSVKIIKKENIVSNKIDGLEYFYEPKANSIEYTPSWLPFKATYNINSDSLNSFINYEINKPDKVYRIMTLGDSFTFGFGVDTTDNYSSLLQNKLNSALECGVKKFEVINLGVIGYDFKYAVERYKIRGQKYNPDLLIWLLVDFNRDRELMTPIYNNLLSESQKTGEFNNLIKEEKFNKLFDDAENIIKKNIGNQLPNYQKKSIKKINDYFFNTLILTFLPWNYENKNLLEEFAQSRPNTIINKLPNNFSQKENFLPDGHPNKKGHEIIADYYFNYIKNIVCK